MTPEVLSELPNALARLDCSGQRHAIRWEAGELVALDHQDPEGERALVALGGTRTPCIEILNAWSRQKENADILSALSRGSLDPIPTGGVQPFAFLGWPPRRLEMWSCLVAPPAGRWANGWPRLAMFGAPPSS